MRTLSTLLAAAVIAAFGFAGTAVAGISVSKAITGIDADNNGSFEITDSGAIAAFLADVPNTTAIGFRVEFTVSSTGGQDLTDVVVADRFGAELDVSCLSATSGGGCTDADLVTKGGSDKEFLTWTVGALPPAASETLVLRAETDQDPGGFQEYTECGEHEFNSGPTAKGKVDKVTGKGVKKRQVSDDGNQILLTVSGLNATAFPECSNCIDDDDDTFVDLLDPGCTDANDDSEDTA